LRLRICFFLLCISFASIAQKHSKKIPIPGGAYLYDSIYIDSTEIANIHWLEYLYFLNVDSAIDNYNRAIPDSTVWNAFSVNVNSHKNYLTKAEFRFYPVVGISYQQAVNYCAWRSAKVNSNFVLKNSAIKYQVNFRLPTEKEWEFAAAAGLALDKYPHGYDDSMFSKPSLKNDPKYYYRSLPDTATLSYGQFKKNFRDFQKKGKEVIFNVLKESPFHFNYGAKQPLSINDRSIKSTRPNKLGLSNTIGNVAEMINEEGISKGGSWAQDLEISKIKNRQYYHKPEAWLGFRCVCEVTLKD
jgi:formylglycine-generating enzyme required for sulfatase activity